MAAVVWHDVKEVTISLSTPLNAHIDEDDYRLRWLYSAYHGTAATSVPPLNMRGILSPIKCARIEQYILSDFTKLTASQMPHWRAPSDEWTFRLPPRTATKNQIFWCTSSIRSALIFFTANRMYLASVANFTPDEQETYELALQTLASEREHAQSLDERDKRVMDFDFKMYINHHNDPTHVEQLRTQHWEKDLLMFKRQAADWLAPLFPPSN
jgi:hypothetical protein